MHLPLQPRVHSSKPRGNWRRSAVDQINPPYFWSRITRRLSTGDSLLATHSWRLTLVDSAKSSIDIQLYLWHSGFSSRLLFKRVLQAADRVVRVRILVDDFLLKSNERELAAVSRYHPNLSIRVFNPTILRGNAVAASWDFIRDFGRLNRRMHNKTFTADRSFTIVGGRNVSDHYFGLDENYNFIDLDILAAGPVIAEVSDGFDLFWNSSKAYPARFFSTKGSQNDVEQARSKMRKFIEQEHDDRLSSFPTQRKSWASELSSLKRKMASGKARFLQDSPTAENDNRLVVIGIRQMTNNRKGQVVFVSPYVIPSEESIRNIGEASGEGIKVGVLAPSLRANNQPAVHGHYRKKRGPMIDNGVYLFELNDQPSQALRDLADTSPVRSKSIYLHAKAIVGDRDRCFVGSLNLDPRAVEINTKSGLLIESSEISEELLQLLRQWASPGNSWRVKRDQKGKLVWESHNQSNTEPKAKWSKRALSFLAGILPIESQL